MGKLGSVVSQYSEVRQWNDQVHPQLNQYGEASQTMYLWKCNFNILTLKQQSTSNEQLYECINAMGIVTE